MIVFTVRIEEEESGVLRLHCETPDTVATPRESEAGLSFKRLFDDWKSPNQASENQ